MEHQIKKDNTPLVFIHYGDSYYLKYTFELAVKFNPGKEVILLGDEANKKYEKLGITHLYFDDYAKGEKIDEFKSVFQYIAGEKFVGGEYWTRFNFYKMFALENLMDKKQLESFWLFDSDVLICEALTNHEKKFESYDYTYHNDLLVPQGLVNSTEFIRGFTSFLIESFKSDAFIKEAKANIDFKTNPQYGLTYMYFFKKYNEKYPQRLINYQTVIDKEHCNPVLFFSHGMELYSIQPFQYELKKVFFYPSGEIFTKQKQDNQFVKLITVNLSWLPEFIIERLYKKAKKYNGQKKSSYNYTKLELMHLNPNEWIRWKRRIRHLFKRIT